MENKNFLRGAWIFNDGRIEKDSVCLEIERLVIEELTLVDEGDGWTKLYVDANDDYWEFSYPQSHLQGGGPPQLKKVSFQDPEE